jgi:hypothetical protein
MLVGSAKNAARDGPRIPSVSHHNTADSVASSTHEPLVIILLQACAQECRAGMRPRASRDDASVLVNIACEKLNNTCTLPEIAYPLPGA